MKNEGGEEEKESPAVPKECNGSSLGTSPEEKGRRAKKSFYPGSNDVSSKVATSMRETFRLLLLHSNLPQGPQMK